MAHFVYLLNTVGLPRGISEPPDGHTIDVVDQYALDPACLDGACGLLLSQHLDERHLCEERSTLEGFLRAGGGIAMNGPVARPFLDPPGAYTPLASTGARDWLIEMGDPHPITTGVAAKDLSYRRGVVGFWARGGFDVPKDAIVLTRFAASGHVADAAWTNPAGGRVFVHPGNDVWGYTQDDTTARLIFGQLLNWFAEAHP